MRLDTRTLGLATLLGLALPATAQDAPDDEEHPPLGIEQQMPGAPNPQQEMIELFQTVERRLQDMGGYLVDAGAGDTSRLEEMSDSGIEELLRQGRPESPQPTGGIADLLSASRAEGQQALEDMQRILELAAQNGGT